MTDMRVTHRYRGKLQPTEAFKFQGSNADPLKPGLPQEPGFLFGSCKLDRCPFGCARAQAPAGPVCMCAAHVLQTESACSGPSKMPCQDRVRTQPKGHCLVSSVDQSAGLRSRRPEVRLLHEAPFFILSRWTSGEVLGPSSRRGGFNSRTGCQTKACRRALASTGANRPQRLGGVGTRHRQPLRASTVCGASGKRNCFGSRGLQVRVLLHGPGMHVAIAQLEERRSVEPEVAGSGPAGGAK